MRLMKIITYIGCGIGALIVFAGLAFARGASQAAAANVTAIAFAVIPYCIMSTMQRAALLDQASASRTDPSI